MMPLETMDRNYDPVDSLNLAVKNAWQVVCDTCDVSSGVPDLPVLFQGVDLTMPGQAASTVMANMLLEVMESVGRFSPWYKMPARAYGLVSIRDRSSDNLHWSLAPEASQKWCDILESLAVAIRRNSTYIQATVFVDGYINGQEQCIITVGCGCLPPRKLQVTRKELENADIICDACSHPFT